ncbi:MAG: DMT family transporter [Spirochaetales bacterium]|nr:DMT family transporter [Spirochaetales bacterium]
MSESIVSKHRGKRAIAEALFVTVLWSSSWVLIKLGLPDAPPLTFAGLRYSLAFLCLVPIATTKARRAELSQLRGRDWMALCALGLVFYAVTQGAQFFALGRLPAQMASLILSFSPVAVALLSAAFIGERPRPAQLTGVSIYLLGAALFLLPVAASRSYGLGLIVAVVGMVANAASSVLGRYANRSIPASPVTITVVSMGIGGAVLLAVGIAVEEAPILSTRFIAILLWLSIVNTALAFTVWNRTLATLTALASSVINGTMLIQIAILAWIFLDESPGPRQLLGLSLAGVGGLIVQVFSARRRVRQ